MKIQHLLQEDADGILKSVLARPRDFPNFRKTFPDEVSGIEVRALPPEKREYYTISLLQPEVPYLLIGINRHLNISSVFRIYPERLGRGMDCLKHFLNEVLILSCHERKQPFIYSTASTQDGFSLFTKLQQSAPSTVEEILIEEQCGPTEKTWKIKIVLAQLR